MNTDIADKIIEELESGDALLFVDYPNLKTIIRHVVAKCVHPLPSDIDQLIADVKREFQTFDRPSATNSQKMLSILVAMRK